MDASTSSAASSAASPAATDRVASVASARRTFAPYPLERKRRATIARDVFLFLVAFRILNALCIRTFFQPDEYFQSLEPAWQIAFGNDSGAWITWEWHHRLRSSIHPYMFAGMYATASRVSTWLHLSPASRAEVLLAAPKVLQACLAANADYHTWKLGQRIYGADSYQAWASLALSVCSAWQWFCSTRTLSNCLETTLTIMALQAWPWAFSSDGSTNTEENTAEQESYRLANLWRSLGLAAIACILRPTNLLIWIILSCFILFKKSARDNLFLRNDNAPGPFYHRLSWSSFKSEKLAQGVLLVREALLCGGTMLAMSALLDRSFYQEWTFPPLRFLYFNIAQSLAVFYGKNDWHYYVTQGFPLLLTTYLPFAILGIYKAIRSFQSGDKSPSTPSIRYQLAVVALVVPLILSFISHKEVRFIYPLLPILHVLAAQPAAACFEPAVAVQPPRRLLTWWHYRPTILPFLLMLNVLIAIFATQMHQLGPLSVMDFLRREHEKHYLTQPPLGTELTQADTTMTVGFLMPCHSTPWRSHLVYPSIKAWALGCEPPVNLNPAERKMYIDEADQFYDDPVLFLKTHLGKPPARKTLLGWKKPQRGSGDEGDGIAWDGRPGKKVWPEYLIFFEALEPTMQAVTKHSGYTECWRGWSSWVHDDWRRKGDVVVLCSHTIHPQPRPIGF